MSSHPWPPWATKDTAGVVRYVVPDHAADAAQITLENISPFDAHGKGADGRRVLIKAIYDGLAKRNPRINYDLEPPDWSDSQQIIRTPHEILTNPRQGTCLDLSLLFCGLCLKFELIPILILIDDGRQHALTAVSLGTQLREWNNSFSKFEENGQLTDREEMVNLVKNNKFLAVECTGFSFTETDLGTPEGQNRTNGFLTFEQAVDVGLTQIETRNMVTALDVNRLQHHNGFGYGSHEKIMDTKSLVSSTLNELLSSPETTAALSTLLKSALQEDPVSVAVLNSFTKSPDQDQAYKSILENKLIEKVENDAELRSKLIKILSGELPGPTITTTNIGAGGVNVGGDNSGPIITGSGNVIGGISNTGGGNVSVGGDFVGGDKVLGNKIKTGRDYIEGDSIRVGDISKSSGVAIGRGASSTVQTGDTFNMSGDFSGAILNIKSTLNRVSQQINSAPHGSSKDKEQLTNLIQELSNHLKEVPSTHAEQADAVSKTAEMLITAASDKAPNHSMVQIFGDTFIQAANNLQAVQSAIVDTSKRIVAAVKNMIG